MTARQSSTSAPTAHAPPPRRRRPRRPSAALRGASGRGRCGRGADGSAGAPSSRSDRRRGGCGGTPAAPSRRRGYARSPAVRRPPPRSTAGPVVSLAAMRALVVVNPAATSTTAKMRDVLLGALGSELKLDVAETTHRGHARELGARAAADGVDLVVALGGDGTVNEVVNGLLSRGPSPTCRRWPSSPAGRPTSSPGRSAARATRSRRPRRSWSRCAPGAPGWSSLGTARASGTATPGSAVDGPALVRLRRRAWASTPRSSRGSRPSGAPRDGARPAPSTSGEATAAFLRRPRAAPPGDDAAAARRAAGREAVPLPGLQRQPVDLPGRPADPAQSPEASFDTGLDVFAMGRIGAAADAAHRPPDARPRPRPARPRAAPPARPRGAASRPPGRWAGSWTATTWARPPAARAAVPAALRVVA